MNATLAGFFSLPDVTRYAAEAERAIRTCFHRHGRYRMLLDVSACNIQSQDVIAAFMQHVQRVPVSRLSAIVVGSSIVRMQVRRVMERPNIALFDCREAAVNWLNDATSVETRAGIAG